MLPVPRSVRLRVLTRRQFGIFGKDDGVNESLLAQRKMIDDFYRSVEAANVEEHALSSFAILQSNGIVSQAVLQVELFGGSACR